MLEKLHSKRPVQLAIGFLVGICFGFLLQRGGVTHYDVLMNQLLLTDWTVAKVILTAILTGMIGIYLLKIEGLAQLHPKSGSVGSTVIGALIFGVGFAILGYCPGTMAGAAGQGSLDALLVGGVPGIVLGTWVYAIMYPRLRGILAIGDFGQVTLPELLNLRPAPVIALVALIIVDVLLALELLISR